MNKIPYIKKRPEISDLFVFPIFHFPRNGLPKRNPKHRYRSIDIDVCDLSLRPITDTTVVTTNCADDRSDTNQRQTTNCHLFRSEPSMFRLNKYFDSVWLHSRCERKRHLSSWVSQNLLLRISTDHSPILVL